MRSDQEMERPDTGVCDSLREYVDSIIRQCEDPKADVRTIRGTAIALRGFIEESSDNNSIPNDTLDELSNIQIMGIFDSHVRGRYYKGERGDYPSRNVMVAAIRYANSDMSRLGKILAMV